MNSVVYKFPSALKRLRNRPAANRIGRVLTRCGADLTTKVARRWPVAGEVQLSVAGVELRCYAAADDQILNSLYYKRTWEEGSFAAWEALLPDQGVVVDIGAHTGLYSLVAALRAPACSVLAVEPHPVNAVRLRRNLALNPAAMVDVVEVALSNREGAAELTVPESDSLSTVASLVRPFSEAHYDIKYRSQTVQRTTLDSLLQLRSAEPVRLLKIDVEGHELAVLQGARRTIERDRPAMICELIDWEVFADVRPLAMESFPHQLGEIEELLEELSYSIYLIGNRGALRVASLRTSTTGIANYLLMPGTDGRRSLSWPSLEATTRDKPHRPRARTE
jgi:FkbM family methyltransferase